MVPVDSGHNSVICCKRISLIAFGYILQAPEGLRLPSMLSNVISVIATAITTIIFLKKHK